MTQDRDPKAGFPEYSGDNEMTQPDHPVPVTSQRHPHDTPERPPNFNKTGDPDEMAKTMVAPPKSAKPGHQVPSGEAQTMLYTPLQDEAKKTSRPPAATPDTPSQVPGNGVPSQSPAGTSSQKHPSSAVQGATPISQPATKPAAAPYVNPPAPAAPAATPVATPPAKNKSSAGLIIIIVVLLVLIVGGIVSTYVAWNYITTSATSTEPEVATVTPEVQTSLPTDIPDIPDAAVVAPPPLVPPVVPVDMGSASSLAPDASPTAESSEGTVAEGESGSSVGETEEEGEQSPEEASGEEEGSPEEAPQEAPAAAAGDGSVTAVLTPLQDQVRRCARIEAGYYPSHITVHLSINSEGSARVERYTPPTPAKVRGCIGRLIRRASFPGAGPTAQHTFQF